MTEQEYRKAEGLNYSWLKNFWKSPAHTMIEFNGNYACDFGKHFEDLIENRVFGTELREYLYVKSGTVTAKAYKEAKQDNDIVIFEKDISVVEKLVDNMLKMEVFGYTVEDLFKNSIREDPLFWVNEIPKKGKVDFYVELGNSIQPFDLKTYGKDIASFQWAIRDGYWIQCLHYVEGLEYKYKKPVEPMCFLVASKMEPYLCQPWQIDEETRRYCELEYQKLVQDYIDWDRGGRPIAGSINKIGKAKFYL